MSDVDELVKNVDIDEEDDDFIEDYDDEEEEEEEEEEEVSGKRKKRRKRDQNSLLLLEAEEDEDEIDDHDDDNEDDVEYITEEITDAPDDELGRKRYDIFRRDDISEHELANEIIKRHSRYTEDFDDSDLEGEETEIIQQSLLPTIRDPKLWILRCRVGSERDIVASILVKYHTLQNTQPLQIYSAISLDYVKGRIYIEADQESAVKEAIEGIDGIFKRDPQLVPISEMPELFKSTITSSNLKKGDWIRVKRGLYKNDLGRVYHYDPVSDAVTIQLIPRIDLQEWARKQNKDMYDEEEEETTTTKKRKRKQRPPQKLFNVDEVRAIPGGENAIHEGRMARTGEEYYIFENNRFRDGFIYKTVNVKSLQTYGVQPTLDELEKFHGSLKKSDSLVENAISTAKSLTNIPDKSSAKKVMYSKGDEIEVIKGELVSVIGTVVSTESDKVVFKPKNEKLHGTNLLTLPMDQVRKHFKPGDHVVVMKGSQHEGTTGFITSLEGDIAHVLTDAEEKSLKIFISDLQKSSDITTKVGAITSPASSVKGPQNRPMMMNQPTQINRARFRDNRRLMNKTVIITKGQWKGYIGKVTNIINNTVKVVLASQTKTVSIDEKFVREQDDRGPSAPESNFVSVPATPRRIATPRRPSTPSHHDTPWQPVSAPPTPGHDDRWSTEDNVYSTNWGTNTFDVQTPMNPHTPNIPHTPHTPFVPVTPHTPLTPNPQTPHTPHPQTPSTPSVPFTPHPMTPMTPGGVGSSLTSSGGYEEVGQEQQTTETTTVEKTEWYTPLIEVKITSGPHENKIGIISTVEEETCEVKLVETKEIVTVEKSALELVVPEKKNKVIIVMGEMKGQTGIVLGIDTTSDGEVVEGIVKLSNLDIKVLDMSYLAKYHGED